MHNIEALSETAQAVSRALDAGDPSAAVEILAHEWPALASVSGTAFRELIDTLPPESWRSDPRIFTAMGASYRSLGSPSRSAALPYFRTAEALIEASTVQRVDTIAHRLIQHAAALRSLGRFEEATRLTTAAWTLLDQDLTLTPGVRVPAQARVSLQQGMIAIHVGDYDFALDRLRLALGLSDGALIVPQRVECLSGLSFLSYAGGNFSAAEEYLALAKKAGGRDVIQSQFGVLALIVDLLLAVERRHLTEAAGAAALVATVSVRTDWEPLGLYAMASISIMDGQSNVGLNHIHHALQLTRSWTGTFIVRTMCEGMRGTLHMHLGELDKAATIMGGLTPTHNHSNCPGRFIAGIKFKSGDSHACLKALDECDALGDQHSTRTLIDVLLLKAAAHYDLGNTVIAEVALDRALLFVVSTGIRTPFSLIPNSTMRWMLARAAARTQPSTVRAILDELEVGLGLASDPPIESLSEREKDIAQRLHSNKTLGEIAADLFISTNTVKTHVKSIYRKLEARNRQEAVRRARELGLTLEITRD